MSKAAKGVNNSLNKAVYNGDCRYNNTTLPLPQCNVPSICALWLRFLRSGRDCGRIYGWWMVPIYYVCAVVWLLSKVLLLNNPLLQRFMRVTRIELNTYFPGENAKMRSEFAKRWYSRERKAEFDGTSFTGIHSRFTYLEEKQIWMEKLALHRCVQCPPVATFCHFEPTTGQYLLQSRWWSPHFLVGWVMLGNDPQEEKGWLITGEIQSWPFLAPLYQWAFSKVLILYSQQMRKSLHDDSTQELSGMERGRGMRRSVQVLPALGNAALLGVKHQDTHSPRKASTEATYPNADGSPRTALKITHVHQGSGKKLMAWETVRKSRMSLTKSKKVSRMSTDNASSPQRDAQAGTESS